MRRGSGPAGKKTERLPAEHGDRPVTDQPQDGGVSGGRGAGHVVMSVVPALTLMVGSLGSGTTSSSSSSKEPFFFLSVSQKKKGEKKKINTREHSMTEGDRSRIEVAVRHCHLVTFVRHCTFKPSFFSLPPPTPSLHPFLPGPIV